MRRTHLVRAVVCAAVFSLMLGTTAYAEIARNKNSYVYDYEHSVKSYASITGTSSTLVDSYTYTAKQYY